MTPAYIKCVKEKLDAMRNSGELGRGYFKPTRAFIRDECIKLYPKRSGREDRATLVEFFKHEDANGTLEQTIYNVVKDDLKALQNFLSGETQNPNYKVVEMTAWLIGFEPRPYDPNIDYSKPEYNTPKPAPTPDPGQPKEPLSLVTPTGQGGTTMTGSDPIPKVKKEWKGKIIAIAMLVVIAGIAIIVLMKSGKKSSECMYWAGDHYEKGACIQRGGDSVLVALDPVRLRNFRRITDTSLINFNSIGKVWYRVKDGKYEFYNMDGKHPVDGKNLRGLTEKSYNNYRQSLEH